MIGRSSNNRRRDVGSALRIPPRGAIARATPIGMPTPTTPPCSPATVRFVERCVHTDASTTFMSAESRLLNPSALDISEHARIQSTSTRWAQLTDGIHNLAPMPPNNHPANMHVRPSHSLQRWVLHQRRNQAGVND